MVMPLTDLTEQERAQAMERFDMLRPVLEEHDRNSRHSPISTSYHFARCNGGYSATIPRA